MPAKVFLWSALSRPREGSFRPFCAARQPAVDRLSGQIRQGQLCIAPRAGIHQVLLNQSCQAEAFIEFRNEHQTPDGGHPRPLKLHAQELMERELTRLMAFLTHRVSSSGT